MANKTATYSLTLDEAILDRDMLLIAESTGWTQKVTDDDGNEIDNPIPIESVIAGVISNSIRNTASQLRRSKRKLEALKLEDQKIELDYADADYSLTVS